MDKSKIYTGLAVQTISMSPEGALCGSVETEIIEKEFTVKTGDCDEESINDWDDISFD